MTTDRKTMKASEVIAAMQSMIQQHGDRNVFFSDGFGRFGVNVHAESAPNFDSPQAFLVKAFNLETGRNEPSVPLNYSGNTANNDLRGNVASMDKDMMGVARRTALEDAARELQKVAFDSAYDARTANHCVRVVLGLKHGGAAGQAFDPANPDSTVWDGMLAATPSPVPADTAELPPLPEPTIKGTVRNATLSICYTAPVHYTADQMRDYARAAIASRPAPVAEQKPVAMVDAGDDGMFAEILPDVSVKVGQMLYAAPVAVVPEGEFVRAGWFLYEGIEWTPTSSDDPRATILYRKAQPDQSVQEGGKDSGCRMTGGICACRSGGSFGGCAKERAYCCTNEPAAAPSAAQAAGVDMDEQLHQFRTALEIIGVGDAPDPRRTAAEVLVQMGFWKREALATTPSEGVAAPVSNLNVILELVARQVDGQPTVNAGDLIRSLKEKAVPAQPSADQGEPKRKILPEPGSTKPEMLLYTDAINGEQVSRDDLWIVTTEVVNRAARYRWLRDIGREQLNVMAHYAGLAMDEKIDEALRTSGEKGGA